MYDERYAYILSPLSYLLLSTDRGKPNCSVTLECTVLQRWYRQENISSPALFPHIKYKLLW